MASLASCGLPKACDAPPPPEALLADASSDVTFASVEMLGPHHYLSSLTRTDSRQGVPDRVVDEVVEISWQDWDNFQVRRLVDGDPQRETIVADGHAWVKTGDRWDARDDAEPHRLQLRTTWNTWDQVLASFQQHMKLVPAGDDIVDGRSASRYTLEMLPADQAPRPKSWGFQPISLQGTVWVDKATAVRLKVQLQAVSRRQGLTQSVRFTLQRSNIGEFQEIRSPPG
ncbi:MAG: hypothetical protein GXP62_06555 [Oligoflexia bacterium]|nr:hypothetical protein [Oligoflexia bacterium]